MGRSVGGAQQALAARVALRHALALGVPARRGRAACVPRACRGRARRGAGGEAGVGAVIGGGGRGGRGGGGGGGGLLDAGRTSLAVPRTRCADLKYPRALRMAAPLRPLRVRAAPRRVAVGTPRGRNPARWQQTSARRHRDRGTGPAGLRGARARSARQGAVRAYVRASEGESRRQRGVGVGVHRRLVPQPDARGARRRRRGFRLAPMRSCSCGRTACGGVGHGRMVGSIRTHAHTHTRTHTRTHTHTHMLADTDAETLIHRANWTRTRTGTRTHRRTRTCARTHTDARARARARPDERSHGRAPVACALAGRQKALVPRHRQHDRHRAHDLVHLARGNARHVAGRLAGPRGRCRGHLSREWAERRGAEGQPKFKQRP
jgi:hypothetical protein